MALGLCKICCGISKNLYKNPISLSQKVVSSKFIHSTGLRNDDAGNLRKIVSETVIKLSRPNINPFESFIPSTNESEAQDSPVSNSKYSQATSSSACNYNVNKGCKKIIESQQTPFQRYWNSDIQHNDNSSVRYYSSNKKNTNKCKKENEKCPKMVAPCCDPPARKSCREPLDTSKCCKQEAPYPSYSEKCVEELIDKPSECKLCPWTPDKHPYFEYVDEFPHFKHPKKPKKHHDHCKANKRQFSTQVSTSGESTFKNDSSGSLLVVNEDEILSMCSNMGLDKKPCKPPPPKCKPEPPKCDKGKKDEKKPEKKKQDDCKKKCSNMNNGDLLDSLFNLEMNLSSKNKNECVKKGKIRKFPFPNPPPIKHSDSDVPCPKPKIKSPIKDCPTGGGCNQCLPDRTYEPERLLHLEAVISNGQLSNENKPFPLLFKDGEISLKEILRHQLYLEDDNDNKCPPTHEKSKICPKESLILPKRKKVKRPPLCSEKEGNKKGK